MYEYTTTFIQETTIEKMNQMGLGGWKLVFIYSDIAYWIKEIK